MARMNNPQNGPQNPQKQARKRSLLRYWLLAGAFAFGAAILIGRLAWLQIVKHDEYRIQAANQQLKDVAVTPTRGQIYDANGKVLAKSSIVWTIAADPSQISALKAEEGDERSAEERRAERVRTVSADVASMLGLDENEVYDKLIDSESQYEVLAKQVDKPVADQIKEYASDNNLPITVTQDTKREYPYGAFAASVLGFMHADGYGFYGLEAYYEETLAGTPGRLVSIKNGLGAEIANDDREEYPAQDGNSLVLTLDANIQAIAEKYLENSVKVNNVSERGVVIIMDVNTGAILAMATKPDFDPNDPMTIYDPERAALLEGLSDEEYTQVQGEERQRQWKNKAITDLYTPGSVFKLITTSAALDSGVSTPGTTYYCGGSYQVLPNTKSYTCAEGAAHQWQDMGKVLYNSCNIATIQEALKMGIETFSDYYNAFGFTEKTGIDLPAEQAPYAGVSYHPADSMSLIDLASTSFGQAQKVTPIQMITAVAAIANGGYLVQPYIVDKIVDQEGNVVQETEPTIKRQVISEEVSQQVLQMMEGVVDYGAAGAAGRNAYVAGYHIGGKSGTSEKLDQEKREDGTYEKVSSFLAVLPVDDPQIAILAFVDEPHAETEYGSMLSAPLIGNIISEVAPYLGIEMDESLLPSGDVTVPNLVTPNNPSYSQWDLAQVELNKIGLAHRKVGSGDTVLAQYPEAGTKVAAGTTVYLYTDSTEYTKTTVPDVTGKSAALASQMLAGSGLNVRISGDENGQVTAQDVAAGTETPMGTVVTITTAAAADPAQDTSTSTDPASTDSGGTGETDGTEEG
ncbi:MULTISPECIES: penicillin-binding transpeptidase domain-containing protein [Allofournierella]|uniref:Penicillin-binding transpeptidase domain-containing protein n=1 Tax=Allofournierella massiliensis TaxID=1650663 RepID=A0ABT7USV1_9FIRM|nr:MULTISPECIES: penicillin-binding transpeptidase domain-containing protein [Fournierella]MDM8201320.1 penicillin-binding transpeptidase domain-containing protein [Fournierella massiliensis]